MKKRFSVVSVLLMLMLAFAILLMPVVGYSYVSVGDVTMAQVCGSDPTDTAILANQAATYNYFEFATSDDFVGTALARPSINVDQEMGLAMKNYLKTLIAYSPNTPALSPTARSCI
jgi:hypothetical protein